MTSFRTTTRTFGLALAIACVAVACGEDAADSLSSRHRKGNRGASSSGGGGDDGFDDPNDPNNPNRVPFEEQLFRALEPELQKSCGKTCHDTGEYVPPAPMFLEGPDPYKAIKAHPGIVVRDVYASALLTKGPHAGPAVSADPEFEAQIVEWLEAEALLIQSQQLPTTPPFTVKQGANEVDLSPAAIGGLTGVKLTFSASLVGEMLSLSELVISAPAGSDVHVLQPKFVRVLPEAGEDGKTDIADPADSFSNSDQTIPEGESHTLVPGFVTFSARSWRPFDLTKDKLRIEMTKLEPGKVSTISDVEKCKNVQGFVANVLPTLRSTRGGGGGGGTCQSCHNDGLANLSLSSNDTELICQQVLQKLNKGNIPQSLLVTKVTSGAGGHSGGAVGDANAWRQLFVNNAGVFF